MRRQLPMDRSLQGMKLTAMRDCTEGEVGKMERKDSRSSS